MMKYRSVYWRYHCNLHQLATDLLATSRHGRSRSRPISPIRSRYPSKGQTCGSFPGEKEKLEIINAWSAVEVQSK